VNKPVTFWSSGVSTSLFDPRASSQRTQLKSQLKIPENAFVLFYHGSLSENRGIIQLITAMSTLQNEVPALILLIVGSGLSEQRFRC
jgi:glycosyltransferase involved in cell wall biosynthesis